MYQINYYVPETHLEKTKEALFAAGAGRIGNYSCCSWQCKGEGQFRPESGSNPFVGKLDEVSREPEFRVELICAAPHLEKAIAALIEAHPYEEPAYFVAREAKYHKPHPIERV